MMKKVFYTILFSILCSLMFFGCKVDGFPMCEISAITNNDEHCTVTLDQTSATLGSYVTIHVELDEYYLVSSIKRSTYSNTSSENAATFFIDEEDPNTYHVLVASSRMYIIVNVGQYPSARINKDLKNCTISLSNVDLDDWDNPVAHKGEKVCFTVNPKKYFCVDSEKISIKKGDEEIPFTKDETDPNKFYFIMPETEVVISTECVVGVSFTPVQSTITKGDEVDISITNKSAESKVDLYYSWGGYKERKVYQNDFDLTAKSFKYSSSEYGTLSFYIYNDFSNSNYYHYEYEKWLKVGEVQFRFSGLDADKKPLSIYHDFSDNTKNVEIDGSTNASPTLSRKIFFKVPYEGCKLKYYYKDKPEDIFSPQTYSTNLSNTEEIEYYFYKEYCYDAAGIIVVYCTDKIDDILYESEKIEINIPSYQNIRNNLGEWGKKETISSKSKFRKEYYDEVPDFKRANYEIEMAADSREFFTCIIDDVKEEIVIESISKTTAIPRLVTFYKKENEVKGAKVADIYVKIPFSGKPLYEIVVAGN